MSKNFSEFIQPETATESILLVGYDKNTNSEVKIPVTMLAQRGEDGASVELQYSADGTNWHTTYNTIDRYMRTKAGTAEWSTAIPIGDGAIQIDNMPTVSGVGGQYIVVVTGSGLRKILLKDLRDELNMTVQLPVVIGLKGEQDEKNKKYSADERYVPGSTELYLNGQRMYPSYDYIESGDMQTIEFLQYTPKNTDRLMLECFVYNGSVDNGL